jgi:hypothetical protein
MPKGMAVMFAVAAVAGLVGLSALLRPSAVRGLLGWPESEGATYGLRIVGMMLTALGLFLGGFATVFSWVSAE